MTLRGTPGQPALLRELNDKAALTLLLDEGALTRNELATRTGLSKPTAAEIIRRLEVAGLIQESGMQLARRGPSAVLYEAVVFHDLGVAIDVQHTDIRSCVVDAAGTNFPVVERRTSHHKASDPEALIAEEVSRACAAAGVSGDYVVAVSVGLQASVDHATDSLSFSDDLTGWPATQVAQSLSDRLGVRVLLENDANLAAIAERHAGAGRSLGSFALMWVAEGLGMALDIGGRVHSGATGAAGEVGYLRVPLSASHLDSSADVIADLVLDTAVEKLAHKHGLHADDGSFLEWRGVLELMPTLGPKHPFVTELAERVGNNILPALAVADPEAVILHGPTGIAGGQALATATTAWLRTRTRWSAAVIAPGVPVTPVLHGARNVLSSELRASLLARLKNSLEPELNSSQGSR